MLDIPDAMNIIVANERVNGTAPYLDGLSETSAFDYRIFGTAPVIFKCSLSAGQWKLRNLAQAQTNNCRPV